MTTKADLIRKYLAKAPEKATSLELHTIGGVPGSSPIASWPASEIAEGLEAACSAVLEAAQEHCDVEAETCVLQMMWCRGSQGLASRRLRAQPSPEATAAIAKDGESGLVKDLLRANLEQNKMILSAIGNIVAACKDTLTAATEQTRVLTDRLQNYSPAEVVNAGDQELKRQALQLLIGEGPSLIQSVAGAIAAHAETRLTSHLNGSAALNGAGGTPTQ
jgi:hypothetical protein